jgi:hypothetical protein
MLDAEGISWILGFGVLIVAVIFIGGIRGLSRRRNAEDDGVSTGDDKPRRETASPRWGSSYTLDTRDRERVRPATRSEDASQADSATDDTSREAAAPTKGGLLARRPWKARSTRVLKTSDGSRITISVPVSDDLESSRIQALEAARAQLLDESTPREAA